MSSNKKYTIADNQKMLEQIKLQIAELEKINYDERYISELESRVEFSKKDKEMLNERTIQINSQIASLMSKNDSNRALELKMSNLQVCPTCLQNVDAVYRANILNNSHSDTVENNKRIAELEEDKKKVFEKTRNLNLEISQKEKEITDMKILKVKLEGINEKRQRIDEINKLNVSLENDISMLRSHIDSLKISVEDLSRYDSIFEQKQKEFSEASSEERAAEIKVAELKKEIEFFTRSIDELKERIKRIEAIRERLNYLIGLENWLSKEFTSLISMIERNVMVKLKAEFSKSFSEWFNMLVSDNFNVRLSDDFTPVIEQQDYEIDYAYLSGGERTAIALAYRLSLNQVINSFMSKIKTRDLVILDEPTDGFSDAQLDKMRGVLDQLNVNQLIVVSHEQKMESFVDNIIKLKKDQGTSGIEN
jgi:exonuclease SbcC